MKKSMLLTIFVLIASLMLSACSPAAPQQPPAQEEPPIETPKEAIKGESGNDSDDDTLADGEELEMTLEELAEFDGTNGKRAYVAVDGIIYDVTDSDFWKNGSHNGFQAGQDLTREIKELSPHGVKNLERVERVGKLDD